VYVYIYEFLLYTKLYLSGFKTNSLVSSYDTRSKSDLFITGHDTKLFEEIIFYNGMLIYDKLSCDIKSVWCIMKFKKIIINFLLEKSFYPVEEIMTVNT